jgi:hypothetical protein
MRFWIRFADLEREVRGRGAHQLPDVLERRLALAAVRALVFAHALRLPAARLRLAAARRQARTRRCTLTRDFALRAFRMQLALALRMRVDLAEMGTGLSSLSSILGSR